MQQTLSPHLEDKKLYNERSHWHWTAFSHEVSGKALAELILEEGLLESETALPSPSRRALTSVSGDSPSASISAGR